MPRRLPRPESSIGLRLDWRQERLRDLDFAALNSGLSVASFTRLALEMLIDRGRVSLDEVRAEASKLFAKEDGKEEARKPKK